MLIAKPRAALWQRAQKLMLQDAIFMRRAQRKYDRYLADVRQLAAAIASDPEAAIPMHDR